MLALLLALALLRGCEPMPADTNVLLLGDRRVLIDRERREWQERIQADNKGDYPNTECNVVTRQAYNPGCANRRVELI